MVCSERRAGSVRVYPEGGTVCHGDPYHVTYPVMHFMLPKPSCEQTDTRENIIFDNNAILKETKFNFSHTNLPTVQLYLGLVAGSSFDRSRSETSNCPGGKLLTFSQKSFKLVSAATKLSIAYFTESINLFNKAPSNLKCSISRTKKQ